MRRISIRPPQVWGSPPDDGFTPGGPALVWTYGFSGGSGSSGGGYGGGWGGTDSSGEDVIDEIVVTATLDDVERILLIGDLIVGAGTIFDLATGPSGEAIIIGAFAKAVSNKAIREAFERQLKQHGIKSLRKSLRAIQKKLDTHLRKLDEIKAAGGHTSSVEREIRTFTRQLNQIKKILGE